MNARDSRYQREHRMCSSKRAYKNAADAYRSADRAAVSQGRTRERLRAYECPQCGKWHLSKKDGTR